MSSGSKRKSLSLKAKIELIEFAASQKISIRQLAEKFKVGKTQVLFWSKKMNWRNYGNRMRICWKILLFLDNATSHPEVILSNVTLRFLPPNTTAECQPLDQGIIKKFKHFYRELIMKRLLSNIDSSSSLESLENLFLY
jgi:hypothetical protein